MRAPRRIDRCVWVWCKGGDAARCLVARMARSGAQEMDDQRPNQPADGRTFVYCLNVSMISGARYQRVATYSVMKPVSVPDGSAVRTERARPKSHSCLLG